MPRTPSLDDLARFRKVTEKGSFVAAARELGIPKSTLSKAIARLEEDLGVRLLERTTRNMRPTEIGRIVAAHGKEMVEAFDAARFAAAATGGPSGLVRISCPPGLLDDLLEDILLRFLETFPKVAIDLQVTGRPVDLIADNVDIALRARTRMEAGASFVVRRLGLTRGVLAASPELLRESIAMDRPQDLALVPTLALPGDGGDWKLYDRQGDAHVVRVSPRLVTGNAKTLEQAAIRGLGVALLPDHTCADSIAAGRLERVLPDHSTVEGTIYAVFSRETATAPALRAFIDHLALEFGRIPAPHR
ncbi:MAG: LysR family transcriptional regulator [Roseovarius sp.]